MQAVTIWVTPVLWRSSDSSTRDSSGFFTTGAKAGIQDQHADRLRLILGRLNVATSAQDMGLPGLDLHELGGSRKGTWAVKLGGTWRVTLTLAAREVDCVEYEGHNGSRY